jgi:FAD/FMN-containing dehydrogenase
MMETNSTFVCAYEYSATDWIAPDFEIRAGCLPARREKRGAAVTQVLDTALRAFRATFTGEVITPADTTYNAARSVWNGEINRRPAVIARCLNPTDVSAAVGLARQLGMEISVRGGAHNTSGAAVADDGLVIDLSRLNEVTVDPAGRRARVGGGALLADMDTATQVHGLATPSGLVSHTGVGGLTLGGGMGWLTRKFGLAVDNLASAEVVVADGRVLRAASDENPELFWAIRGGGGNFGVITSFEFRLHEVGPQIQFGLFFWELDQGVEVLRLAREVIRALPADLNAVIAGLNAPPAPFVPEQHHGKAGYALLVAGFGSAEEHERVAAQVRETLAPLFEFVGPMPYLELQQLLDEANAWGLFSYEKGLYVEELSDQAIAVIVDELQRKHSPLSQLLFYRLDGAYSAVGEDATAFGGGRSPRFAVFIVGMTSEMAPLAAERDWVRSFWAALRPHATGLESYVNGMAEFDEDRVRAAYGPVKIQRLAQIKGEYDPENLFHRNANIKPTQQTRRSEVR